LISPLPQRERKNEKEGGAAESPSLFFKKIEGQKGKKKKVGKREPHLTMIV